MRSDCAFTYFPAFIVVNRKVRKTCEASAYIQESGPAKHTGLFDKGFEPLDICRRHFLAAVAILPVFVDVVGLPESAQIGGTSLLIVISVALETMKQLEGQLVKRHYKGLSNNR